MCCGVLAGAGQTPTSATTVPLLLPGGLAFDGQGNLYFAETARHLVRRVSPAGILSVVAGTGTQGFGGDGGPAIGAMLDSPAAVAVDSAGDIFVADTHNHRIRRIDAVSGIMTSVGGDGASPSLPSALAFDGSGNLYFADAATHLVRRIDLATGQVTTVAGNGTQGFSGDGGPATGAAIDSPSGIALDSAGNLYLADTHNHRVRRVDAVSGMITTVAGTGQPGFSGDMSAAANARVDLPRGLVLDSVGNLFLVDSRNQRLRRIDAVTGQISTVAGDGTQGYAGDGGAAVAAELNMPRAIALSPANLPTLSDSGNGRIRQIDASAEIHTFAGLGAGSSTTLTLAADSVIFYGTGSIVATLAASPATGSVTFFDAFGAATQPVTLATIALSGNAATDPTTALAAGIHHLTATYAGDATHSSAVSGAIVLNIAPAAAAANPTSVSLLYGLPIPALTGSLNGILPQDSGAVDVVFATAAGQLSPAASYPITASLSGPAAGNYALTTTAAAVTIAKAPADLTLTSSLTAHVASTTSGAPTGSVNLLDGASLYAVAGLTAAGDAMFSSAGLSSGSHTLTAVYPGDGNFLATAAAPLVVTIGAAATPDFTLAATSPAAVTIPSGNAASFAFAVAAVNGALSSPILLTATGLPLGATASFSPAYLPPGSAPASFTLTIRTVKAARVAAPAAPFALALLVPVLFWRRRRRVLGLLCLAVLAVGCGTRVNETSAVSASPQSYNITVIATATTATGTTLQHTTAVTLTLQ